MIIRRRLKMGYSVIFGAGKIARGFIAHLLFLSGEEFVFIEKAHDLVELINKNRQYTVNILGAPEKNAVIKNVRALSFEDVEGAAGAIAKADTIFTAVGGKNLNEIVPLLVKGLKTRFDSGSNNPLNIITCENWKLPAELLKKTIMEQLNHEYLKAFGKRVGITEAVVMRSAIEADAEMLKKDPLIVNVQDFWELPIDASRLKGNLPTIKGIKLIESFEGFLERKFYTYNAANGTVSYLGYIKGYEKIADAAHDGEILEILTGVYEETSMALSAKHKFPLEEQLAFTKTSLKKLQDYTIVDYIERNARDPIRKLGPDDRLVGSARLVLDYGFTPCNLAAAIAAALYYDNPADPVALELKAIRETKGIDYILEYICRIEPGGKLGTIVKQKVYELKCRGWIKEA
jgi:mannitol-1-phosphate 5-dehydrogenase